MTSTEDNSNTAVSQQKRSKDYYSPYVYTTFKPPYNPSVREVYQQRIISIYEKQYPIIIELPVDFEHELLQRRLKRAYKGKKVKKEKVDTFADSLMKQLQNASYEESLNAALMASMGDKKASKLDGLLPCQRKLIRALKLLDDEYLTLEHELYLHICHKYNITDILAEYELNSFQPSLMSEKLLLEKFSNVECYECKQTYDISLFNLQTEIANNGHFVACIQCEPDRSNIKNLRWSLVFKTADVKLSEMANIAKITSEKHHYLLADMKPMKSGIHCFRWKTDRFKKWCMWGISHMQKFNDQSFQSPGVWGMTPSLTYVNGQQKNISESAVFYDRKLLIPSTKSLILDMLLDFNAGELRFRSPLTGHECVIPQIPKYDGTGFVPHANVYYSGGSVQIKKIPLAWFGKHPNRVSFHKT